MTPTWRGLSERRGPRRSHRRGRALALLRADAPAPAQPKGAEPREAARRASLARRESLAREPRELGSSERRGFGVVFFSPCGVLGW